MSQVDSCESRHNHEKVSVEISVFLSPLGTLTKELYDEKVDGGIVVTHSAPLFALD